MFLDDTFFIGWKPLTISTDISIFIDIWQGSEYACIACINPYLLQCASILKHCSTYLFECLSKNMSMFSCKIVSIFRGRINIIQVARLSTEQHIGSLGGNTVKGNGIMFLQVCAYCVCDLLEFNPFQPSVAFHIKTSHLICSPNEMAGFYMKCNTRLKSIWVWW